MARPEKRTVLPPENILLVEGKDDRHVLWSLFENNALPEVFQVVIGGRTETDEEGGYEFLRAEFQRRIKTGYHKRLGIVIDADTDLTVRWQSLRQLLLNAGYTLTPERPNVRGTIILPENIEPIDSTESPYATILGIWIMPDNTLPGALENFVRFLVPAGNETVWEHAQASVAYLPTKPEPLTDNWRAKACIHTYLAWQREPGSPMGLAITKKYLTSDAEVVTPFLEWIRRLFEIAA